MTITRKRTARIILIMGAFIFGTIQVPHYVEIIDGTLNNDANICGPSTTIVSGDTNNTLSIDTVCNTICNLYQSNIFVTLKNVYVDKNKDGEFDDIHDCRWDSLDIHIGEFAFITKYQSGSNWVYIYPPFDNKPRYKAIHFTIHDLKKSIPDIFLKHCYVSYQVHTAQEFGYRKSVWSKSLIRIDAIDDYRKEGSDLRLYVLMLEGASRLYREKAQDRPEEFLIKKNRVKEIEEKMKKYLACSCT